jgi:GTP1/Obg family GTP-binding protein
MAEASAAQSRVQATYARLPDGAKAAMTDAGKAETVSGENLRLDKVYDSRPELRTLHRFLNSMGDGQAVELGRSAARQALERMAKASAGAARLASRGKDLAGPVRGCATN